MSEEHRDKDSGAGTEITDVDGAVKHAWQEPKLTFVEPKLVKQGEMKEITTQGLIGTFVP
jgi:hypothetical protein